MFECERFVEACRSAIGDTDGHKAIRELVAEAVSDPGAVIEALGEPRLGAVQTLYRADDLTILNIVWPPGMVLLPHDHRMWAVIGLYTGREDNIYWRRLRDDENGRIEAAGARSLGAREVLPLGKDIIHSVSNPLERATGAIHVYGGDFFAVPRSEWDPEDLSERTYDVEANLRRFETANARLASA